MSKDDFDIFHHFKRDPKSNVSFDFIKGLEDRKFGHFKKNEKATENIEVYAEDELVRKKEYEEMRCEMPGLPRSTFLMVFSPDGSKAASTHGNHNIYVTDIRSGKNIKTLVGHPRTPWCIAFHPTSNQIVASGCLGGQVRIWDLSGGSEVWTANSQSVIASIAFHPNDRVLVIATFNEVYFWDWSKPEPFVHAATSNIKEKVRYVAFDKVGHKLITGIANTPQTRWERVRAPVPVPRQAERCASPYRRRITPRLVNLQTSQASTTPEPNNRETLSSVPERERRITFCYRNLVREYEQLVQRYLQLYRPPTMVDRGTDPMEPIPSITTSGTQTPKESTSQPSTSGVNNPIQISSGPCTHNKTASNNDLQLSTNSSAPVNSENRESPLSTSQNLITPSRIFSVIKRSSTLIRSTQTPESRKHKSEGGSLNSSQEKRIKINVGGQSREIQNIVASSSGVSNSVNSSQQSETSTQTQNPRKLLVINSPKPISPADNLPSTSNAGLEQPSTSSGVIVRCPIRENPSESIRSLNLEIPGSHSSSSSSSQCNVDELLSNIRKTAEEEVRNRILPIIRSVPANDRPELIRLFENSREHVRKRFRQMCPIFLKKSSRRPLLIETSSDSSSSDDERSVPPIRLPRRNSEPSTNSANVTSNENVNNNQEQNNTNRLEAVAISVPSTSGNSNSSSLRNFNTELEQLVTTLLTEIERNETDRSSAVTENVTTVTTQTSSNSTLRTSSTNAISSPSIYESALPSTSSFRTATPTEIEQALLQTLTSAHNSQPLANNIGNSLVFPDIAQASGRTVPHTESSSISTTPSSSDTPPVATASAYGSTRTTNSTIYSSSMPRRRFFSHRVSAFMPTRVNYTRTPLRLRRNTNYTWGRGRLGLRALSGATLALDELINFSERANSEDDPPPAEQPNGFSTFDPEFPFINLENIDVANMYHNIVQDLESSLIDVENIRASSRPGETSSLLSSFSQRLENIMNQSDMILRNLRSSMEMLSNTTEQNPETRSGPSEPRWSFNDQNFYVRDRDHRSEGSNQETNVDPRNGDLLYNNRPFNAIATDHTYPRNPESPQLTPNTESMSPLLTSLHLTITHIQRQARLLRQQVDSIIQIDRVMQEVSQLQLIRQLLLELARHFRTLGGGNRNTGMSSVREMMAGTRISDSSPHESQSEEQAPQNTPRPSSSTANTETSRAEPANPIQPRRGSNRKTYPPSRLFRLQRQSRRPSIVHFYSRRYMNRGDRGVRQSSLSRIPNRSSQDILNPLRNQSFSNYSVINSSTLSLMTRRLEHLLMEQRRLFICPQETPQNQRSSATTDLGEHILALRLHGCVVRINRIMASSGHAHTTNNLRADPTDAVTQDGVSRYSARQTLSLIVDGMSRNMEEVSSSTISQTMRFQIHGVLAMSLVLSQLLILQVVDSIPPLSGNLVDPEREALTSRIDQMCGQLLLRRFSGHSNQLSRSLRLMRLTMRNAYRVLGQTYNTRRNAMLYPARDRLQLLDSINRCLRLMNRINPPNSEQNGSSSTANNDTETNEQAASSSTAENVDDNMSEWYNTLSELVTRYSYSTMVRPSEEPTAPTPSTSSARTRETPRRVGNNSSNNSDDNDEESEWYGNNNNSNNNASRSTNLYRTSNVTLAPNNEAGPPRNCTVPSVQINDVPVSEPSLFHQRIMSQRQRFAERVSELRSNPTIGLFRPRFLHPLYASVNPFDADLDDPQRDQIYESDMITTVTPNHRIQAWDISDWTVPVISNPVKNIVVSECKIHNDASVDVAKDGTILVTLLPSGGYLNVTNRLGVYSLKWETLGQCLYTTSFEQNAVSVSLSPLSRHLAVGLASRRVSIVPSERWVMARIFKIDRKDVPGDRLPVLRELEQNRDSRINCIRFLPSSGQGLIYATNTGQLIILT